MNYGRFTEFSLPGEEGDVGVCTCSDCGALLPDDYDHRKLHEVWHYGVNQHDHDPILLAGGEDRG